ncbi:MAG: FtsL-like putative cell division protein [Flavobacteriaceae bacterium]|nr:FtsL-like putative cell division protein [Flavobacteriaceae bacterium]
MKESLKKILLGKFLINEGSIKNWSYIFFLFTICLIMIYSSHSVDSKIIKIGDLKNEISVLQSRFINKRKEVMKLKMESNVSLLMIDRSITSSSTPPKKIIID